MKRCTWKDAMAREQWGVVSALRGDERGAQKGRSVNERVEPLTVAQLLQRVLLRALQRNEHVLQLDRDRSQVPVQRVSYRFVDRVQGRLLETHIAYGREGGRSELVNQCEGDLNFLIGGIKKLK